jgi:hypothetical protein
MSNKRPPFSSPHLSRVLYPSALFSLERDEILPYERFAYCILGLTIEVLHDKGLAEDVTISFGRNEALFAPWQINAGIRCHLDSNDAPRAFEFLMPELLPGMAFLYCSSFATDFVVQSPEEVRSSFLSFLEVADAAVKAYKQGGISAALRAAYDKAELVITEVNCEATLTFDLLAKQIGYHEVAHGYANLLGGQEENPVRRRSFELVADLLATQWLYKGMIVNTPDTAAYRKFTGAVSYGESIYRNCQSVQRSYFALLGLFALAGAQRTGGRVSLDGGTTHPPGMQRHVLLHVHFMTLVRSNFAKVLSGDQLNSLDKDWSRMLGRFHEAGIILTSDIQANLDPREADTLEAAADVIESKGIKEVNHVVPLLRDARHLLLDVLARQQRR